MHSPRKRPTPTHDFLLGVVSTIALPLTVFRVLVAAYVIPASTPLLNASTSIATAAFVAAAFGLAWRRSVLRSRAERAELLALVGDLERRLTETENTVWWGTTPTEPEAERTVDAETTVVPFRHRKSS